MLPRRIIEWNELGTYVHPSKLIKGRVYIFRDVLTNELRRAELKRVLKLYPGTELRNGYPTDTQYYDIVYDIRPPVIGGPSKIARRAGESPITGEIAAYEDLLPAIVSAQKNTLTTLAASRTIPTNITKYIGNTYLGIKGGRKQLK